MAKKKKTGKKINSGSKQIVSSEITKIFRENIEIVTALRGSDSLKYLDLDTKSLNRRMQSVQSRVPMAVSELEGKCQDVSVIEEKLIWFEAQPFESFEAANYTHNIYLGAALWILDELKKTSKIHEIYQYLPQDFDVLMDADLPWDFHDIGYDEDLIRSMMIALASRNCEPERHNAEKLVTEKKKGKHSIWREQYDAIIAELDPEIVEQVCWNFKEKQKDFLERFCSCVNIYCKREKQLRKEIEEIEEQSQPVSFGSPVRNKQSGLLPGLGGVNQSMVSGFPEQLNTPGTGSRDNLSKLTILQDSLADVQIAMNSFSFSAAHYCHMTPEAVMEKEKSKKVAEIMTSFQPGNPYEMCFAFLYLLDRDNDDVWLHNTSLAVVNAAGNMLPWRADETEDDDEDNFDFEDLTFNYTDWLERDNHDELDLYGTWYNGADFGFEDCARMNLAQLIYKLSKSVPPREMHPFQETRKKNTTGDPKVERAIDMAELLFLSAFESQSAGYDAGINSFEIAYNADSEEGTDETPEAEATAEKVLRNEDAGQKTMNVPIGGYWGSVAGKIGMSGLTREIEESEDLIQKPEEKDSQPDAASLSAENHRLQDEIKKLKKALYETGRSVNVERKQLEQEREKAAKEHRELADLRELVFNQQEGKYEEETEEEKISFPYNTQLRTVVFGGHDSWAREIKPKLPKVRFIDANATPNAELIRNADVVWIQSNCIGHSNFYKIIDEVRKHNVPLRYFTYASATKCAEQLVMAENNNKA